MRKPFVFAYILAATLAAWSLLAGNYEFLIYAVITFVLVALIHVGDGAFDFDERVLWGFDVWLFLHILGGLWQVGDHVLYSVVLVDFVGEPYSILKYDQVVHTYCYFIVALLLWRVVTAAGGRASPRLLGAVTVLAASGVGGIWECLEFATTLVVPEPNVGGYENTAIDLVANLLGACLAIPFFRKPGQTSI